MSNGKVDEQIAVLTSRVDRLIHDVSNLRQILVQGGDEGLVTKVAVIERDLEQISSALREYNSGMGSREVRLSLVENEVKEIRKTMATNRQNAFALLLSLASIATAIVGFLIK